VIIFNLFPGGVTQLYDLLRLAIGMRAASNLGMTAPRVVEWARLPGDLVFIFAGVAPLLIVTVSAYASMRRGPT
jgi:nitric oxide reductase subunit B